MPNAYEDWFNTVASDRKDLEEERGKGIAWYGFSIPNDEDIAELVKLAGRSGYVEVGAGIGFWASLLAAEGIAVTVSDIDPPKDGEAHKYAYEDPTRIDTGVVKYVTVEALNARDAMSNTAQKTLLCIQPDFQFDFLDRFEGDRIVIIQEDNIEVADRWDTHTSHLERAGWTRVTFRNRTTYWPRYPDRFEVWEKDPVPVGIGRTRG